MGLFGHMRIHERGTDLNTDSPIMPNPATTSSPCAYTALPATDTGTTEFTCPRYPQCIAQRLANQCLGHQPIPTSLDSTAHTALASSGIA
nr:unnamed protein product [Spirometra erinaceieuropaei]